MSGVLCNTGLRVADCCVCCVCAPACLPPWCTRCHTLSTECQGWGRSWGVLGAGQTVLATTCWARGALRSGDQHSHQGEGRQWGIVQVEAGGTKLFKIVVSGRGGLEMDRSSRLARDWHQVSRRASWCGQWGESRILKPHFEFWP